MNKLKFLSWFALTVFSATAWAQGISHDEYFKQGPWIEVSYETGKYSKTDANYYALSYNALNGGKFGECTLWCDGDGMGITVKGSSGSNQKHVTYSIYKCDISVESFTRARLTWNCQIGSKAKQHHSMTTLYGKSGGDDVIKSLVVDCTENNTNGTGSANKLLEYKNTSTDKKYQNGTVFCYFDNRDGSTTATKSNRLLLVHVITSGSDGKSDLHEWGAIKHSSESWAYDYYKHITFYGNGATSGSMGNQTIENSGTLNANAYSRTGYTYDGWATSATGGKVYNNQAGISANSGDKGNVYLYAHWNANQYTVSFNTNSGSGGSANATVTYDANMPNISVPTRAGYIFQGYFDAASGGTQYYKANGTSARTWNKASNATLYAQWTAATYTVSFNKQSGSGGSASVTATYASNMPSATMPTRTGYTFNGYFDAASGGNQYYKADGSSARTWNKTAGATLYAQWSIVTYTISYDLKGGTVTGNPTSYNVTTNAITLKNPTRTGYVFLGWTGSSGTTPQTTVTIAQGSTGNKSYTANWVPLYNITYDYNKGKGTNPATYSQISENFQLAAPTRLGYTFLGWTGSNGTTPQTIVTIAKGSVGDKNYVAHWELNPNTHVSYLDSLNNMVEDEMSTFNRPIEPDIEGFTFVTWEVKEGPLSEGITLQAIYTENEPSGAPKKQVGKFTLTRRGDNNEYILQTAK